MQDNLLKTSYHAAFAMLQSMKEQLTDVCLKWRCELLEFNGEEDPVHLLVSGHPAVNLGRMVGNLKT